MSGNINNSPRCPYIGLTPYSEEDADFFFGREDEREIIRANLFASRLTLLYGESGVGKSSVLRAGIVHHLRQESQRNQDEQGRPEFAVVYFNSWIDNPLTGLVNEIRKAVAQALNWPMSRLPAPGRELDETLEDLAELVGGHLLIMLDQFEDYFLYQREENTESTFAYQFPKAVNRPDLRANFLISMRHDTLAKLDRFKGIIPNLFENRYQIRHLSTKAARVAIEKPIEQYNHLYATPGQEILLEPSLVDAVLKQLKPLRDMWGETGKGANGPMEESTPAEPFIETPFLQLVMDRLWKEEIGDTSHVLRLSTLNDLGGAKNIARTHLDEVMDKLPIDEQQAASRAFYHLVTSSGTKIAYKVSELADYTKLPEERLLPLLEKLSGPNTRIIRPIPPPPGSPATDARYEIFHDVLAPAALHWRVRYRIGEQKQRAEEQARIARLFKRLTYGLVALSLLCLLALAFGLHQAQEKAKAQAIHEKSMALLALSVAALESTKANFYDIRGIARALIKDYQGAIDDFTEFINRMEEEKNKQTTTLKSKRTFRILDWISISQLKAGRNPIDKSILGEIKKKSPIDKPTLDDLVEIRKSWILVLGRNPIDESTLDEIRKSWILVLGAGRNPIDESTLDEIKKKSPIDKPTLDDLMKKRDE